MDCPGGLPITTLTNMASCGSRGGGHGDPTWANWNMSAPWLCAHMWDHIALRATRTFSQPCLALMRGAAEFLLAWLIEDGQNKLTMSFMVYGK